MLRKLLQNLQSHCIDLLIEVLGTKSITPIAILSPAAVDIIIPFLMV